VNHILPQIQEKLCNKRKAKKGKKKSFGLLELLIALLPDPRTFSHSG